MLRNRSLLSLWLLVLTAIPVWVALAPHGWDAAMYRGAIQSLKAGRDPYTDGIAAVESYRNGIAQHPGADAPFIYLYSPVTLPLLRVAGMLPGWLSSFLWWTLCAGGVLVLVSVGLQFAEPHERPYFLYFVPIAAFFPGLLASGTVMGGNVAYILYGAILFAALHGWKRDSWTIFYVVTVLASCFKMPMLSFVLVPFLSAPRQWKPALVSTLAGFALFAMQPRVWPALFHSYLEAIAVGLPANRDFGCAPAGLLTGFLYDHHFPLAPDSLIFYAGYAIPVFACLLYLSRHFFSGRLTLERWGPLLLMGVILLNPRLIEYDVAALTLPMALIAWRFFTGITTNARAAVALGSLFVVINAIGLYSWDVRKLIDGPLLVVFFVGYARSIAQEASEVEGFEIVPAAVGIQPS